MIPSSCCRQSPVNDQPGQVRDQGEHQKLHHSLGHDPTRGRQWGPRLCYDLHWQKPCLRRRGRNQRWVRRIAPVTQPSEDQIGVHRVALRNLGNRNTLCRRLETDRPLLFIRPKPLRPPRRAITKVPTIDRGHYPTLSVNRRSKLTPHRPPILTPLGLSGSGAVLEAPGCVAGFDVEPLGAIGPSPMARRSDG